MYGIEVYGIGIVTEDKEDNSHYVLAFPIERLPGFSGNLTDEEILKISGGLSSGDVFSATVTKSVTVRARWLREDNKITAPDVRKGESIELLKVGESDKFFWRSMGESTLRKKESVVNAYSNTDQDVDEEVTTENSYYTRIDTKNKAVELVTNMNDGEPVKFHILIDTETGVFSYTDSKGNIFKIDAVNGDVLLKSNTSINLEAPTVNIKATNVNVDAKTTTIKGGALDVASRATFKSTSNFKSKVTMNGNASTSIGPHGHTHVVL